VPSDERKSALVRNNGHRPTAVADNLSKAGWSWGCVSSTDHEGRQFWVVAAEREDARRMPMKCALHFWNYKPRFIVDLSLRWKVMRSPMFC
jgi:hypothetical protein